MSDLRENGNTDLAHRFIGYRKTEIYISNSDYEHAQSGFYRVSHTVHYETRSHRQVTCVIRIFPDFFYFRETPKYKKRRKLYPMSCAAAASVRALLSRIYAKTDTGIKKKKYFSK